MPLIDHAQEANECVAGRIVSPARVARLLEMVTQAEDDRERQPWGVVARVFETGCDELIDFLQSADVAQPDLPGEIQVVGKLEQRAEAKPVREGGRLIVIVGGGEDDIRLGCGELNANAIDEPHANGGFSEHPYIAM